MFHVLSVGPFREDMHSANTGTVLLPFCHLKRNMLVHVIPFSFIQFVHGALKSFGIDLGSIWGAVWHHFQFVSAIGF